MATQVLCHVKDQLLAMRSRDEHVRSELEAEGSLFEGYHQKMEAVHRTNADELRAIIGAHGWPSSAVVGADGSEAAWLVVQHSIGEPDFMRYCRTLIDDASRAGHIPRWQFAYLDDRIRVFEGRAQRFGTQFDIKPDGPEIAELEDPDQADLLRREVGLGPVSEAQSAARGFPLPTKAEYELKQTQGNAWRRKVGWIA